MQNLKEGVSYVFRVRAINQAGVGKPSDLAGPVVAETRPGRPVLWLLFIDTNPTYYAFPNFQKQQSVWYEELISVIFRHDVIYCVVHTSGQVCGIWSGLGTIVVHAYEAEVLGQIPEPIMLSTHSWNVIPVILWPLCPTKCQSLGKMEQYN